MNDPMLNLSPSAATSQERGCLITVQRSLLDPRKIEVVVTEFGTSQTALSYFSERGEAVSHCKDVMERLRSVDEKTLFVIDMKIDDDGLAVGIKQALMISRNSPTRSSAGASRRRGGRSG